MNDYRLRYALLLSFLGSVLCFQSYATGRFDDDAERDYKPAYLSRAFGPIKLRAGQIHEYAWPVDVLSIGHTIASFQNYTTKLSGAYFHHGLDIRAEAGSPVKAVVGGKVINIENYIPGNEAYWEIAIQDDEGYIWQYHHVESGSIPQAIHRALASGAAISSGTYLGNVIRWPIVSFGERYNHIHLNVIGEKKSFLNGFAFLKPLKDDVAPEIKEISLFKDGQKVEGFEVNGQYTIIARIEDSILNTKFLVPAHKVVIELDGEAPQTVWSFDTLPGGSSPKLYVNNFFVPHLTCGDYDCRRIFVDLAFDPKANRSFPVSMGMHHLRVIATDFAGNSAEKEFSWRVS